MPTGSGLLSHATFVDRLDVLVSQTLIEPERLIGDLTFRSCAPRRSASAAACCGGRATLLWAGGRWALRAHRPPGRVADRRPGLDGGDPAACCSAAGTPATSRSPTPTVSRRHAALGLPRRPLGHLRPRLAQRHVGQRGARRTLRAARRRPRGRRRAAVLDRLTQSANRSATASTVVTWACRGKIWSSSARGGRPERGRRRRRTAPRSGNRGRRPGAAWRARRRWSTGR